ncbi:acyl-coenzyme A synthetase/AMP-(fatty) acid ligase [Paucimonas lemoignei]|uniref:Acyl-coenzyme A synthetase/AMP-(Fatty) acid ligase n=1 Tax=Paucimonas lemoignei TaxID=29443 RepID=A0A4R3HR34_PAULE|nr:AMP-binding protein [Paucimonas lemoignei]TCS35557.1 acyl-coenzyme A synthetase/AMP-(fatty) acid ligase [Paucimonas lemoignei]
MANRFNILDLPGSGQEPNRVVGWRNGQAVSHAELVTRTSQWRATLQKSPDRNVALFFHDSLEFAAALLGAWHAAKTVYLPSDTLPATCASLRTLVTQYIGDFPPDCQPVGVPADDAASVAIDDFGMLDANFTGLVVFTSGSTGTPQAIPKKLSQLATEVATLAQLFGKEFDNAAVIATVSHQHIYGLLFKVLLPLAYGSPIEAISLSYPEQIAAAIAMRDSVLVASPAHLKRLPDTSIWDAGTQRLRAIFSSGGPLPEDVAHATARLLGRMPIEVYGSSETGGIACRQRHADNGDEWQLMPGIEARIAEDGESLEVCSPHLPDATWFRCSDRARMIDARRFTLHGRADRIVKIEEKRISLDLMETRLRQSALVAEARVVVAAGNRDRVAAFVVLSTAGRDELVKQGKLALNLFLREWLAECIERVALPRSWRYLDALPVNAQGKTTQADLMALLNDTVAQESDRATGPRTALLEKDATRALFALEAAPELPCFDGHFPQTPILPGVAQVQWAVQMARDSFALPAEFCGIHALKFQRVIRPAMPFSLEMQHDPLKNSVSFRYFSAEGNHASGKLMFGAAHV